MKLFPLWFVSLLLPSIAAAADAPATPASKPAEKSQWVFSILPKSLQRNADIDLTVMTEMTEEGKKLPPATPAHPVFYSMQSGGKHGGGDRVGMRRPLPEAEVERLLTAAFASSGYRPAELPAQPPTLAIFFIWGTHNGLTEGDPENPMLTANQITANLLDRARLVGGEKFAHQMFLLFREADDQVMATNVAIAPGGQAPVGPTQQVFLNPVALYKMKNPKNEFLVDQAGDDIYYIVASAYDYQALTTKRRKLLWRTSMTVSARGVSEEQTLPIVISSAAPFFGRETPEAETFTKRIVKAGQVEVGTPSVVPPTEKSDGKK